MKKLWFKAKRYGWGWYPSSWQGVLIILIYVGIVTISEILFIRSFLSEEAMPSAFALTLYSAWVVLLTSVLILICYRTGEKPRWRWGK